VIVSRAGDPALALVDDDVVEIHVPELQPAETKGAGDSMTAGTMAALLHGADIRSALRTGGACGAINVVRRGLGTGGPEAIATLADRVELKAWKSTEGSLAGPSISTEGSLAGPSISTEGSLAGPSISTEGSLAGPSISTEGSLAGPSTDTDGSMVKE
jgi:hypothetical protein